MKTTVESINVAERKTNKIHISEEVFTPADIISIFSAALRVREEIKVIRVKGVFRKGSGKTFYNNYCYEDKLCSQHSQESIKLKISETMRLKLENQAAYTFSGTIEKKVNVWGSIELLFRVTDVVGKDSNLSNDIEKKLKLLNKKRLVGYKDVDKTFRKKIISSERITIAMVSGKTSVAEEDINRQFEHCEDYFEISTYKININNKADFIAKISELDKMNLDAITVTRGGGPGLEVFEDHDVLLAASSLNTPLVTAIGHAEDTPFIQDIADRYFPTPTAFGHYLSKIIEDATSDKAGELEKLRLKIAADVEKEKKELCDILSKKHDDHIKMIMKDYSDQSKTREEAFEKWREMIEKQNAEQASKLKDEITKNLTKIYAKTITEKDAIILKLSDELEKLKNEGRARDEFDKRPTQRSIFSIIWRFICRIFGF